MANFVKVATTDALAPGEMTEVQVGDEEVLLANLDGQFYAVSNICTHAAASLHEGHLQGEEVECPLHASTFNVKTGAALAPPAYEPLARYEVKIEGTDILLKPAG